MKKFILIACILNYLQLAARPEFELPETLQKPEARPAEATQAKLAEQAKIAEQIKATKALSEEAQLAKSEQGVLNKLYGASTPEAQMNMIEQLGISTSNAQILNATSTKAIKKAAATVASHEGIASLPQKFVDNLAQAFQTGDFTDFLQENASFFTSHNIQVKDFFSNVAHEVANIEKAPLQKLGSPSSLSRDALTSANSRVFPEIKAKASAYLSDSDSIAHQIVTKLSSDRLDVSGKHAMQLLGSSSDISGLTQKAAKTVIQNRVDLLEKLLKTPSYERLSKNTKNLQQLNELAQRCGMPKITTENFGEIKSNLQDIVDQAQSIAGKYAEKYAGKATPKLYTTSAELAAPETSESGFTGFSV